MLKNKFMPARFLATLLITGGLCLSMTQAQDTAAQSKKPAAKKPATAADAKTAGPEAVIDTPDKINWIQYSPGVEMGPLHGDCDKPGAPCVFQLRFLDGGKFPPHWHPVDENVTVISGSFMAGMGDSYDESKMMTLPPGTYVFMPHKMHHFAGAKGVTVVQVHGVGPFKINYVNPADDPSKGPKTKK